MSDFDNTKVDSSNLLAVWQRVAELTKKITGEVNVIEDGTLQDQIIKIINGSSVSGKASMLSNARTIQTKLNSTASASFNGTQDITPGVTGILPISNGGTGASTKEGILTNAGVNATASELNVLDGITASTVELNYVKGVTSAIQDQLNKKSPLASPTFTGTPKAPTAAAGTNTTQIATTAFVQTAISNGIAASDAMIIKGTIGTSGTVTALPTTYKIGWTYRVVTAGTYAGQTCEIGDLIVALVDRNGSNNTDSDWCVAQTNINGAITGVKSGDAYIQHSQSGSVVTITHKDVTRTNTTSTAKPNHGGTFTAVKTITSDAKGHVTGVDTETVTLPTYSNMTAATADAAGKAGLVPAPAAGKQTSFLRGDGTWVVPTDTKATQTNTTDNNDYRLVLSTNANDTTETNNLRKSTNFRANPSTGAFYAKGFDRIEITGQTLDVNTLNLSAGSPDIMRYINKTSGGASNITNIPVTGQPFILDVELIRWASTTDYVSMQRFISAGAKANEYVRYCANGTWDTNWTKRVFTDTNTKNTAGSTDSSSKLFLIGATSQAANPQTYSHDTAYVDTNGHLYSNSKQVVNLSDTQALTNKTYNGYTLNDACGKGVLNNTEKGALGWTSGTGASLVPTINTMAYWNGAYSGTNSNLAYCVKGAFGSIVTKNTGDFLGIGGGTMTGNIVQKNLTLHDGVQSRTVITMFDDGDTSANYGSELLIGGSGNTFIGGGESVTSLRNALIAENSTLVTNEGYSKTGESMYVCADTGIYFETGCNNIADRKVAVLKNDGTFTVTGNVTAPTFVGALSGNASTASKAAQLTTARTISLTGDATASGSFNGTTNLALATTLANSGVTAGSYGPSANASPAHKGTFSVPYFTVDSKGRITAASTKTITLPADNNTTYSNFVKSGSGAKAGLVPAPPTTEGTTKYLREDGTWQVPPNTNTDTKVTNTLNTTAKAYITGTTSATTNTGTQVFDTGVYLDTTAGQLVASKFKGALVGNADSATKATQDSDGKAINSTYLKLAGGTLTGDLTVKKATPRYYARNTAITRGTKPSADSWDMALSVTDTNGNIMGGVEHGYKTTGETRMNLIAHKPDGSTNAQIAVGFDSSGNAFTYAPTPTTNDNSTNIATTAHVKANLNGFIKGLSVSGKTITYTKGDGTTGTITTQDTNTTYSNMTAATSSAAGKAGLVPAPAAGKQTSFLRGDGTWVVPTNTTYSNFVKSGSGAKAGLVPAPSTTEGTTKYLREDGTWQVPPNTNTKNTAGSTDSSSKLFLIGATSQAANPQTYSHDTAYVGTDGCLYSGSKKVSVEGHTHSYLPASNAYFEFNGTTSSSGHGGYLDFHFNGSTADYTSRIIESASGTLTVSNNLVVGAGTNYTTNKVRNSVFTTTDPGANASTSHANGSIICVYE